MNRTAMLHSDVDGVPVRRGKVRDIYDFGEKLLLVATDRISAFDWVLPTGIPDKGRVLTQLSEMWFARFDVPHHCLSTNLDDVPLPDGVDRRVLAGRSMVVYKAEVVPIECVVRGYLAGSGWREYRQSGTVCGITLPDGLRESDQLPEPIFTPATKSQQGHDENIRFDEMCEAVGQETSEQLRQMSLALYRQGAEFARQRGIIVADTKFEFGWIAAKLSLIDEVLTPDSSRFWPADAYEPGRGQLSFDKQFLRDWLETTGWDKKSEPPALPEAIVERTRARYLEAFRALLGREFL